MSKLMKKMLRIISGGQDGADLAGWKAAKSCGLPTGGFLPPQYMTSSGPHSEYADLYGAVPLAVDSFLNLLDEIDSEGWKRAYRQRTILNVEMSHAVVWFGNVYSPGAKLTLGTASDFDIPHYVIPNSAYRESPTLDEWIQSIIEGISRVLGPDEPVTIMVAGNRETKNRGIEVWVYDYLIKTFAALKEKSC